MRFTREKTAKVKCLQALVGYRGICLLVYVTQHAKIQQTILKVNWSNVELIMAVQVSKTFKMHCPNGVLWGAGGVNAAVQCIELTINNLTIFGMS